MKDKSKRLLSYLLLAAMLLTLIPFSAFAVSDTKIGSVVQVKTSTNARAAAIYKNYLYTMEWAKDDDGKIVTHGTIKIYNISDVSNITAVTPTSEADLTVNNAVPEGGKGLLYVHGDYLYAGFDSEVRRYSLTDPTNPALVGRFQNSSSGSRSGRYGMAVFGDWLISSSENRIGSFLMTSGSSASATDVSRTFSGSYAPVAADEKYVYLLGITSSSDVGTFDGVYAVDAALYAPNTWNADPGESTSGVTRIHPKAVKLATVSGLTNTNGNKMLRDGNYLYFSDVANKKVYRIDVSTISENKTVKEIYSGDLADFAASGDMLYVHPGTAANILTYTLSADGTATQGNSISTVGQTKTGCIHLCLDNGYLYFSDNYTINLIPVTEQSVTMGLKSETPSWTQGTAQSFGKQCISSASYGDYLYVHWRSSSTAGIDVYDVSTPAAPTKVTTATNSFLTNTFDGAYGNQVDTWSSIAVSGKYLYYGVSHEGVRKFDLTNPAAPAYIATYTFSDLTNIKKIGDIAVDGGYLYAANDNADNMYCWSDTETTTSTTEKKINSQCSTTELGGSQKIMTYDGELYIFRTNVFHGVYGGHLESNEGALSLKKDFCTVDTGDKKKYYGMEIHPAGYAYLITSDGKLAVVDIRNNDEDLKQNVYLSEQTLDGFTAAFKNVLLSGNYLYIGGMSGSAENLYVFDVSVPTAPKLVATYAGVTDRHFTAVNNNLYGVNKGTSQWTSYIFSKTESLDETATDISSLPVTLGGEVKGGAFSLTIDGTAVDSGKITVADGKWSYTIDELAAGNHTVCAAIGSDLKVEKMYSVPSAIGVSSQDYTTADSKITGSFTLFNKSAENVDLLVVTAGYKDNKLTDVDSKTVTVYAGQTKAVDLTIKGDSAYTKVVTYFWKANGLQPVNGEIIMDAAE